MEKTTKETILDTAEHLFAENGIAGVSLRKLISEAGVNLAAVHYHFGSKDGLVQAVFRRRLEQVNAQRMKSLGELRASFGTTRIPVKDLLQAFLTAPVLLSKSTGGKGRNFFRLIARAHAETNEVVNDELYASLKEVIQEFLGELSRSLPELTPEERAVRLSFVAGAMVQSVLLPLKPKFEKELMLKSLSEENVLDMLVAFCTGGMSYQAEIGSGGKK